MILKGPRSYYLHIDIFNFKDKEKTEVKKYLCIYGLFNSLVNYKVDSVWLPAETAEKPASTPEPPCPSFTVVQSEQKKEFDEKSLKNLSGQETLDYYREGKFEDVDCKFCIMCNYGKIICMGNGCKGKEKSKKKPTEKEKDHERNMIGKTVGLSEEYKISVPDNLNPKFEERKEKATMMIPKFKNSEKVFVKPWQKGLKSTFERKKEKKRRYKENKAKKKIEEGQHFDKNDGKEDKECILTASLHKHEKKKLKKERLEKQRKIKLLKLKSKTKKNKRKYPKYEPIYSSKSEAANACRGKWKKYETKKAKIKRQEQKYKKLKKELIRCMRRPNMKKLHKFFEVKYE